MTGISKRQARTLEKQLSRLFGRHYTAVRAVNNTLSIGDILTTRKDNVPHVNGNQFSGSAILSTDGPGINKNIFSSSKMSISTKIKGEMDLRGQFDIDEAGITVSFESENDMFLKVHNLRQRTVDNFPKLKKEILNRFYKDDLKAKVFIVRGVVIADKFYLQYGSNKNGTLGIKLDPKHSITDIEVNADFNIKWSDQVGFSIDGSNGGILGYRVSKVKLKRDKRPSRIQDLILTGISETEAIDNLTLREKQELLDIGAFDIIDATAEYSMEENES